MYRQPQQHPTIPDRILMECWFNDGEVQKDWERAIPKEVPAGYRPFWRWIGGNRVVFGVEPIEGAAVAPTGGDVYDKLSDADLQTLAPQKGIKHASRMQRGDLIAALRMKETAK